MKNLDLAGIGIGPFNLSLAALLAPLGHVKSRFFERRPAFDWHPGMLLPNTRMQTSYLKDLVTPVDPTNACSFLSYLVSKGRFYRFVNADYPRVRRAEFADYLNWAAGQLPNLSFGRGVESVEHGPEGFRLRFADGGEAVSENLAVATGWRPQVPHWAEPHLGRNCQHSHGYMTGGLTVANRRVAIVGGGQSGVEIFLDLMAGNRGRAAEILLITRRAGLDPLDETAFTNEYFTPGYLRQLHRLPDERRRPIIGSHKFTGDGVSPATLQELSQYLYDQDFLAGDATPYRILPHRAVHGMARERNGFRLHMSNGFDGAEESCGADVVICATGYRYAFPDFLAPIAERICRDEEGFPRLAADYSVQWDGPPGHRIYMQNAGRNSHGVADAQLSLAAWRSAGIVNSLLRGPVYTTDAEPSPLSWAASAGRYSGGDALPAARAVPR